MTVLRLNPTHPRHGLLHSLLLLLLAICSPAMALMFNGHRFGGEADPVSARRNITIVTTAAIPWNTGTAVNPTVRAVFLAQAGFEVTLVLPWVAEETTQRLLFGGQTFATRAEQEEEIWRWCREGQLLETAGLPLKLLWYDAQWITPVGSLFSENPLGPTPNAYGDILIAEEPEHLGTFDGGPCWKAQYSWVVGVIHTNYDAYMEQGGLPQFIRSAQASFWDATILANVDRVIKLSDFEQPATPAQRELDIAVENVNGVSEVFLRIGEASGGEEAKAVVKATRVMTYYIGKSVWGKGYDTLLQLARDVPELAIDTFGSGADEEEIRRAAGAIGGGRVRHHPGVPHSDESLRGYDILINPSTSDVVCTVSMEALAMGKCVVLPDHPSNQFFIHHFPDRCFVYEDGDTASFKAAYDRALSFGAPRPLAPEQHEVLTWRAATQRFLNIAGIPDLQERPPTELDETACSEYRLMQKSLRLMWQEFLWMVGFGELLPRSQR